MMLVIGTVLFTGAMALSLAVLWYSVAPQWQRIVRLAGGHVEQPFLPLEQLARAERRIAVRRWAAQGDLVPAWARRQRAA